MPGHLTTNFQPLFYILFFLFKTASHFIHSSHFPIPSEGTFPHLLQSVIFVFYIYASLLYNKAGWTLPSNKLFHTLSLTSLPFMIVPPVCLHFNTLLGFPILNDNLSSGPFPISYYSTNSRITFPVFQTQHFAAVSIHCFLSIITRFSPNFMVWYVWHFKSFNPFPVC